MKKRFVVIPVMLGLASLMGCATNGDLAKVQAQQKMLDAKADQAAQDAQAAKAAADAATSKAEAAAARAEEAEKKAEEREKVAQQKADLADAAFRKSMRK